MLAKMMMISQEGTLKIHHAYLGHIKKDDDRKILAYADALPWEAVDNKVRATVEYHLHQAMEGPLGEKNFAVHYTGEPISTAKVAGEDHAANRNRPAVEVLESISNMTEFQPDALIECGNNIAYKIMSAGAIKNHLVVIIRFSVVPQMGASPVMFTFATLLDLEDREDSLLDTRKNKIVSWRLNNVVKDAGVSKAVFFPSLDDEMEREVSDLLLYAGSGAGAWFKAMEAKRMLAPQKEAQALVKMIAAEMSLTEVPPDIFRDMGGQLEEHADEGLPCNEVIKSLEKVAGYGIDRLGFQARWESAFGDLDYRPDYNGLFGEPNVEKPLLLKMEAGEVDVKFPPALLEMFRQVTTEAGTFIMFQVPEKAKVVLGKDLSLKIKALQSPDAVTDWLEGQ